MNGDEGACMVQGVNTNPSAQRTAEDSVRPCEGFVTLETGG